jgi:prevent-host-death family protein
MNTINTVTAKELRDNLSAIMQRAEAGEEILVIRRSRPSFRLVPENRAPKNSGTEIAKKLQTLAPQLRQHRSSLDPNKSYKELYDETLRAEPKYRKYYP